jgi:hypothetical protein
MNARHARQHASFGDIFSRVPLLYLCKGIYGRCRQTVVKGELGEHGNRRFLSLESARLAPDPTADDTQKPDGEVRTFANWAAWKAAMLNRLFAEQGVACEPGHITAATIAQGERDLAAPIGAAIQHVYPPVAASACPACGHLIVPNVGCGSRCVVPIDDMPVDPRNPHQHIDPATGIWPTREWGAACRRGFVSDSRFGAGQVVPRTNRASTRKWRKLRGRAAEKAAGESQ